VTLPLLGSWWNLSPAFLVLGIPLAFRATCYYYRRAYYRSFFWSPPACAVPDARPRYSGETVFPFLLNNIHRYVFWLAVLIVVFLWWDALLAFRFPTGLGIGLGTVVLVANVALLSLYTFSCHSCRHLCGGYLDSFAKAPLRFRLWQTIGWRMYDWLLLFLALTHGQNGLRIMIDDYVHARGWRMFAHTANWVVLGFFLVLGTLTIVSFPFMPGTRP
jgi:succinate dehydrogenase hydrophobic anchor subunit